MGQQQLLLIILGVIIVGIAIAVGITMFTASATSANRDAVINDLNNLAAMAQQYYRRPLSMAGGGNEFTNWVIPPQLDETANGTYALSGAPGATEVVIVGTGTEIGDDGENPVAVTATVTATAISMEVDN